MPDLEDTALGAVFTELTQFIVFGYTDGFDDADRGADVLGVKDVVYNTNIQNPEDVPERSND